MDVKEWFEMIYYISGIVLVIGVFIGIKQFKIAKDEIQLLKKDYETRNKRASVEKSIEYLNLFATEFIPKASEVQLNIKQNVTQIYKGPINNDFRFDDNCNLKSKYIQDLLRKSIENDAVDVLNRFEYFSAAFVSGLADEELAFTPLSRIYCEYIESMYVVLCYLRKDEDHSSFENTVKLYNSWKKRLEKSALEKRRSKLDDEISQIQTERIKHIGHE
ncbi:DUF4760 domain-containing protein [Sporosarcina obsidiansis]|uniref:DUF4760 domain-containing protein n=1 Tax=Sporosarcina obsidiansis TaxID=2660748 RepID=UPI00129A29C5|nr:hypothetical protein [Sporosarcina obsidiansis]